MRKRWKVEIRSGISGQLLETRYFFFRRSALNESAAQTDIGRWLVSGSEIPPLFTAIVQRRS